MQKNCGKFLHFLNELEKIFGIDRAVGVLYEDYKEVIDNI